MFGLLCYAIFVRNIVQLGKYYSNYLTPLLVREICPTEVEYFLLLIYFLDLLYKNSKIKKNFSTI